MSENKDLNRVENATTAESQSGDSSVANEALEAILSTPLSDQGEAANTSDSTVEDIDKLLTEADPKFSETLKNIQAHADELNKSDNEISKIKKINWKEFFKKIKSVKFILATLGLLVFICIGLFVIWKNPFHFADDKLFITSWADLGGEVHEFTSNEDQEAFYDNPRFTKNLISISRMIVNVKPSENSGENPMLAIEINAEGISPEATIELKDREAEFKDLLIRQAEEFTYDELITTAGKQNLCDQFRLIINANLTNGQIRKVFLKSFVIKP